MKTFAEFVLFQSIFKGLIQFLLVEFVNLHKEVFNFVLI